jgi:hypothetical protein
MGEYLREEIHEKLDIDIHCGYSGTKWQGSKMMAKGQILYDMARPEKDRLCTYDFGGFKNTISNMKKVEERGKKDPNRNKVGIFENQIAGFKDAEEMI